MRNKILIYLILSAVVTGLMPTITSASSISGWGRNDYGQAVPPAGNDFVAIAAGGYHNIALKELVCVNKPLSDLNGDCKVNFADFAIMAAEWLNCGLDDQQQCWP